MIRPLCLAAALACGATMAPAITLDLPGDAVKMAQRITPADGIALPSGAWDGAQVPVVKAQGDITRTAWQLRGQMTTPLQIRDVLVKQLTEAGWQVVFECRDRVCGGYDFRFASNTLPAPGMYVDLGNFRYLLAERDGGDRVALMISRGGGSAYVQITQVDASGGAVPRPPAPTPRKPASTDDAPVIDRLLSEGRAPLDDLLFATGSARLDRDDFPSLRRLAAYLSENRSERVAIVGHTDTTGGLEPNIALSRKRAEAVRDALVGRYGVDPGQVMARGVGYLAPRRTNDTAEGRLANRRVEVVRTTN